MPRRGTLAAAARRRLMMMSPNCSGSTSRPSVVTGISKDRPDSSGCCADQAGDRFDVLARPRRGDLAGGDVARGQLLRVEPGPDAVVALTQVGDVRDAWHPQQLILDVDRGEVAQVDVVVAPVGRDEVDEHQQVGRLLLDREALPLHRPAAVAASPATRGSAPSPAPCSGPTPRSNVTVSVYEPSLPETRGHVEHAGDTVDLLLDRRGDGIDDDGALAPG